jgi:hypothetical protein
VEELNELAGGYADAIIEELYEHFFAFEETRGFFSNPATFDYVKGMQEESFPRLTEGDYELG